MEINNFIKKQKQKTFVGDKETFKVNTVKQFGQRWE
jgi:hypothetical protein